MKQVEELIRGELSAIQSFDTVLSKINDLAEKERLTTIRADHARAVDMLKKYAGSEDLQNAKDSGAWGAFAKAFAGGGSFFGDKAAIQALKVGEEHGLKEYKAALESKDIQNELRQVIQSDLLPQQEQ